MPKPNFSWWTLERVQNGLNRFIRDYFEGNETELPWNFNSYRIAIPADKWRESHHFRLYPPFQIVARYYESMAAAWSELGWTIKERSLEYWTREEVIAGLGRFQADFGFCATSTERYLEKAQFSPKHKKNGEQSDDGAYNKYPSFPVIRKFFNSMREAWTAAGFDVDKWWEPWSPLEDWFILESVGILPRTEVAEVMKRTVPAIKRRLYDLGRINSKNRWGITVSKASTLLAIGGHVITKYIDYGIIPCFRGYKCIYLNPADLLEVREIDWQLPVNPELEILVKRALIQRALKILEFRENWRGQEIYTFQKTKDYLAGRIKRPRQSAFAKGLPEPPNDLKVGDWVTLTIRVRQVSEKRIGIIKGIFYSPQKHTRPDGTKRTCWIASVDFPKIRRHTPEGENRIRYNLPLDLLQKSEKPAAKTKPLKMNPEAIRSRVRRTFAKRQNYNTGDRRLFSRFV